MEFDDFARAQLPRLLRYAVLLTGDRELAQDLVQDVMVSAHRHWARVTAADHPDRYVHTMVTRAYLSWRRRWAVRRIGLTVDGDPPAATVGDPAAGVVDRDDVWRRLAGLPRQQRAVLVLRYWERLPDAEIAAVLGCAPSTVRAYASRALTTLRLTLDLEKEHR